MINIKRFVAPAATLLLSLTLCGCSRSKPVLPAQSQNSTAQNSSSQPEQPANAQTQNSSVQPVGNGAANDNASSNSPAQNSSAAGSVSETATANSGQAPEPLIIPAGTSITVRLQQSLSSASAPPGEPFDAVLDQPVVVGNNVVLPVGAAVSGHVTIARRSGRLRHPGELGLTLDSVRVGQQQVRLATAGVVVRGGSHKRRNLGWIGGGSGGGALIGALAAGGKGALIGGGIGAAAGTTTALITGKKNVGFSVERRLSFRLRYDISLPT